MSQSLRGHRREWGCYSRCEESQRGFDQVWGVWGRQRVTQSDHQLSGGSCGVDGRQEDQPQA